MPKSTSAPAVPMIRWMLLLSVAFPLLALLLLGQDQNWDLQNYHLYNPHAWLHGRLALDIAPAQLQSWHNPMLDVPMYLMTMAHWPGFLVCVWLALPSMLAMYLLLRTYALLSIHPLGRVRVTTLAVFTMGGVGFFAVVGTCLDDAFVAAGIIGSLYLLLREEPERDRIGIWFLAGVISGAITGLKLTAASYCLGLAGAAIAWPSWRRTPFRLGALLGGGIIGVALTFGYWGALMFHLHGNPVFPYYNQIFHSPDAAFVANTDLRFKPATVLDALLTPFRLLTKTQHFSEMNLKDPRLLLGLVACIALPWRALGSSKDQQDAAYIGRLRGLSGFFVVGFLAWSLQYGIYRYAIPLEMIGCLGFVLMLEWLPASRRDGGAIIGCLLAIAMCYPATWGRSHFQPTYVDVRFPALPHDSMIVLSSQSPLAYAVTALPDDVPAIAIDNTLMHPEECNALTEAARRRIANHTGPLWLLRGKDATDDEGQRSAAMSFGLVVSGACQAVPTNFGGLSLCPLRQEPRAPACAKTGSSPGR